MAAKKKPVQKPKKATKRAAKKRAPAPAKAKKAAKRAETLPVERRQPDHPAAARPLSPPPVKLAYLDETNLEDDALPLPKADRLLSADELNCLLGAQDAIESDPASIQTNPQSLWNRFVAWLFMVPVERA